MHDWNQRGSVKRRSFVARTSKDMHQEQSDGIRIEKSHTP